MIIVKKKLLDGKAKFKKQKKFTKKSKFEVDETLRRIENIFKKKGNCETNSPLCKI